MLCKCHWIVLYTVHFTAFCLGGPFFPGHGVLSQFRHQNSGRTKSTPKAETSKSLVAIDQCSMGCGRIPPCDSINAKVDRVRTTLMPRRHCFRPFRRAAVTCAISVADPL